MKSFLNRTVSDRFGGILSSRGLRRLALIWTISAISLTTILLWMGFERNQAGRLQELRHMSRALAEHTARSIDPVNQALRVVAQRLTDLPARDSAELVALDRVVHERLTGVPQALGMMVFDADGRGIVDSASLRWRPADISGSAVFRQHRDDSSDEMRINVPDIGRVTGAPVILMSRRISHADGSFAGLVVAIVDTMYFAEFYGAVRNGAGTFMALYRDDGIMLAVDPYDDTAIGRSDAHRPLFMTHLPLGRDGSFSVNVLTSNWRLAGYRHVESYPLVMTVQQSQWSALSTWWIDAAVIEGLGLFATVLLCVVLLSLARAAAQREDQFARLSVAKAKADARARKAETMAQVRALMVANMGHELRSPLNAVIGFSEVLKGGGELATRRMQDYAASIHRAGSHLLQVVEDLLDTASLDAGKLKLSEGDVDPIEIVRFVADIVQERATKGGLTLAVATPNQLPLVRGDALRLRQVLLNLAANAIKYTRRGGTVTLAAELQSDGRLRWRVSDDGVGMSAEQVGIALEPFGRVDNEMTREHDGHGLGLPLAKSLTELHGGMFEIESAPGAGTTVRIVLPRDRVVTDSLATAAA